MQLNYAMAKVNNALLPKEGEATSRPWQWPINYRGTIFHGWSDDTLRVYLLGNPVVFWFCLPFLALAPLMYVLLVAMRERARSGAELPLSANTLWVALAWLLHYAPFFVMDRVLYFHHYMPAFLFSTVLAAAAAVQLV